MKYSGCYSVLLVVLLATISSTSYALKLKRDGFLQPGSKVLLGRQDTLFKVCNRTSETLSIAIIYQYHWRNGEPPTWPAKGWIVYSPGECSDLAVNNFIGVMAVVTTTKNGKVLPYYSSSTPLEDITIYNNEVKKFATEYFCLGEAPFDEYRDNFTDYRKCDQHKKEIPFNLMFKHGGGENYTLNLY